MRIYQAMKSQTRFKTAFVIASLLFACQNTTSAHATQNSPPSGTTIDVSGSAHGDQIMAGVEYGASPAGGGGADSACEWSESTPRDASATGPGVSVTKLVGPLTYQLYDVTCPDREPPTTFHWLPQISTEGLAQHAASIVYDNLPAPWGNFAPPARRGFINIGMWFWVNWALWNPISVTVVLPTLSGPVSVTTTATPKKLIFEPGDGDLGSGPITCDGPGMIWMSEFGDKLSSPCMYTYRHSSATRPSGLFESRVGMQWHVTWTSSIGLHGTFGELTLYSSHQMNIREVQALIIH